jgi:uncharacterized protein DUF6468
MILDLPTDLLLDGLVAVLLAATIFFCALLDRRLKALRSGQDGMKAIIDQLNTATARAEVSIGQLKQASGEIDSGLSDQVHRARAVADELSVMVASGANLANRLDDERPSRSTSRPEDSFERKVVPLAQNEGQVSDHFAHADEISPNGEAKPAEQVENGLNKTLLEALKKAR